MRHLGCSGVDISLRSQELSNIVPELSWQPAKALESKGDGSKTPGHEQAAIVFKDPSSLKPDGHRWSPRRERPAIVCTRLLAIVLRLE